MPSITRTRPVSPTACVTTSEQFGLIGLHIIQRVHAGAPGGPPEPAGGTYIFATWEHQSIGNGAGYSYVNYSKFATNTEMPFPNTAAGLPVARLKPYPLPTTQAYRRPGAGEPVQTRCGRTIA